VQVGRGTWNTPFNQQQSAQSYGHFNPSTTNYPPPPPANHHNNLYNQAPYIALPTPMSKFARSPSQAPSQAPESENIVDPVIAPKNSMASTSAAGYDHTKYQGAATRRKNIYFPNARSAKTIWAKRKANAELIKKAVESEDKDVKAASIKEYTEQTFEQLDAVERGLWDSIAKAIQQLEQSFTLVPHE
jgi:hypothetical protein